jgi:poly(A) polymerase/tRNA nucleotidyltransferase (CCA-adding enzyme)
MGRNCAYVAGMVGPDDAIIPPDTSWLAEAGAQTVCAALAAEGAEVFFVGGCVRDALLRIPGGDVDIATSARPEAVVELAEKAGLKAVPTGFDHGTVTIVARGKGYEVTTFRRDVKTDGRRAEVVFSDDIAEDARRRDFTLNALYATPQGVLVDPLAGLEDCLARRIRFIEDADRRIREDYLRILRYFRFHAWYAAPDSGFDAEALAAIASNIDGLETLSAERVGGEMMRLLAAPDPAQSMALMQRTGVLAAILPGAEVQFLAPSVHLEASLSANPDPVLRLAALGGEDVASRLRLSRQDCRLLEAMTEATFGSDPLQEIAYRQGERVAKASLVLRNAVANMPVQDGQLDAIHRGNSAVFPLSAADLMPEFSGKALGLKLKALEKAWIASDFALDHEALMVLASR